MTDPLFLAEFDDAVRPGALVVVAGDEAHHAVSVKRIARGESVLLSNGHGLGLRGGRPWHGDGRLGDGDDGLDLGPVGVDAVVAHGTSLRELI